MSIYDEVDCTYHRSKNIDLYSYEERKEFVASEYQEAMDELTYFAIIWDVQSLIKKHGWRQVKKDIMKEC